MRRALALVVACLGVRVAAAAMVSEIGLDAPDLPPVLTATPPGVRARPNPVASDPEALRAGRKLYARHCASCHGDGLEGTRRAPGLLTDAVSHASAGELEWFLRNGKMRAGMPSWSGLPEARRWQIVAFLQSSR